MGYWSFFGLCVGYATDTPGASLGSPVTLPGGKSRIAASRDGEVPADSLLIDQCEMGDARGALLEQGDDIAWPDPEELRWRIGARRVVVARPGEDLAEFDLLACHAAASACAGLGPFGCTDSPDSAI